MSMSDELARHPNARKAEERLWSDLQQTPKRESVNCWQWWVLLALVLLGAWVQGHGT